MLKNVKDIPFVKNVLTLMFGTIASQGISIAIAPLLTRLFTPEDFGLFSLYVSITSVIGIVICGRYELTIIVPKKDSESINLMALSFITALGVSLILLLIAITFNKHIVTIFKNPLLEPWLYIIPGALIFTATTQILNGWHNRKKRYKDITTGIITTTSASAITNLTTGYMGYSSGLVLGNILGQISTSIKLLIPFLSLDKGYLKHINVKDMKLLAKRFSDYPTFNCIPALLTKFASMGPVFFLSIFFSPAIVGFYGLTMRILSIPSSLVSSAVSRVYIQEISEAHHRHENLLPHVLTITKVLSLLAIIPIVILIPFGPTLFQVVFGPEWIEAGQISQVICFLVAIRFVVSPLSCIFSIVEKVKLASAWHTFYAITSIATLWYFVKLGLYPFLIAYTVHDIIQYSIYYIMIIRASNTQP